MTRLLEQGIEAVRALPEDRQDMAGQLLLNIARNDPRYRLTIEQIEDIKAVNCGSRSQRICDRERNIRDLEKVRS